MKAGVRRNYLVQGALLITVGVVAWGFMLAGSPGYNRKLAGDKRRSEDLNRLQSAIEQYYRDHKELPSTLGDLSKRHYSYWYQNHREDPITKEPYGYRTKDSLTYDLCANFELDSKEFVRMQQAPDNSTWEHPAGKHCFEFVIPAGLRG